jgi:hypothetical protein
MKLLILAFAFVLATNFQTAFCQIYILKPYSFYKIELIIENNEYEISQYDSISSSSDDIVTDLLSKGKVFKTKDSTMILKDSLNRWKKYYLKILPEERLVVVFLPYFNKNDTLYKYTP